MNPLAVLIPVKSSGAKSRLSPLLSRTERDRLESLMLSRVLGVLGRAGLLSVTRVVSSDPAIARLATASGAGVVREAEDGGVNSAVRAGVAASRFPSRVLVLPSDLPLLRATEVRHLLSMSGTLQVVIAPSASFNGTNALLFPTKAGFVLSYDNDSFWNHLRGSGRKGLSVGVCSEPGLLFDLDSPDDLRKLARSRESTPVAELARRATG